MIQKLPAKPIIIHGIILADIFPTITTEIANKQNPYTNKTSHFGNENSTVMTTTMITTGTVQQQLTPLLYEMMISTIKPTTVIAAAKTTARIDVFSRVNNKITSATTSGNIIDTELINNHSISDGYSRIFVTFSKVLTNSSNGASIIASSSSTSITSLLPSVTASSIISSATETIVSTNNSTTSTTTGTNTTTAAYSYILGMAWPKALIVALFILLILVTIVGNTLVILAVLTTRRLRTVTNCFVMNLAITDWLVGTCVMPPSVILYALGSWRFGWILCDIWISLDVLLCTGSILSLCAISLDRYLAVTQPLTYSKKRRSKRLALFMIFIVWVMALSITCPPYLGWYEPGRREAGYVVCRYNQNKGYVVFSAMGSFFIPLAVMMYVYLKIGYVLTSRRQRIVRDANSERTADNDIDCDNFLSESEHFQCATPKFPSFKNRWTINGSKKNSLKCEKCNSTHMEQMGLRHEVSFYELVEISRLSSLIHCSALSCKYGGSCMHTTPIGITISNGNSESNGKKHANTLPLLPSALHFADSRGASFSETCLTTTTSKMTSATLQNVKFDDDHHHHNDHHRQHINQHLHQQEHKHHHHDHHQHHHHHHHHHHRVPMRISTTKRDTKTTKTLTIVMGGFVICWLPFFVYYLLIPFLPKRAVIEGLQTFLTWVGWVNCAINPFIYAFYNPDFRIAFWRLTCRKICKQKPPSNHLAMFRG